MAEGSLWMAVETLEHELANAIRANSLFLEYQPIFDIKHGRVRSAEALVRWAHPSGPISPMDFIPQIEDRDSIHTLGKWVLISACLQGRIWHRSEIPLRLSVNIAPLQLAEECFADVVCEILESTGFPPSSLELEITERFATSTSPVVRNRSCPAEWCTSRGPREVSFSR
jgi:EAL domain-containing protein (putative c-di-GMP-specific phosphodiesterase class I)